MVYSLLYKRPSRQSLAQASLTGDEKQRSLSDSTRSGTSTQSNGIPDALSFDNIINGATCPPCTTRDFMNYLKYIEHDAENLQFYLWYRDYVQRFCQLPEHERALSPEWSVHQSALDANAVYTNTKPFSPDVASVFAGTDFDQAPRQDETMLDPFSETSLRSPSSDTKPLRPSDSHTDLPTHNAIASDTFAASGLQWKPFTTQPFREELARIISIYLAPSSPRQLNLSSRERDACLHALQNTTHPSALHSAITSVEYALRRQSHPNFIRWAICNGNRARVIFARGLGAFLLVAALLADILLTLSSLGRGYRVIPLAGYVLGIATLVAGIKGMCVVLHGMHHRHVRPWELFGDDDESSQRSLTGTVEVSDHPAAEKRFYFDKGSLISEERNSYEDEPWVARYEKRNVVRKVFDREVWIQEPAMRQVQDTIFLQSMGMAVVIGGVLTGIFVAVPKGNFF